MPSNYDNNLLREGILNIKAKDYAAARRYLERAREMADDMDTRAQANYYLSQLTDDPLQKREYLEETLAINPTYAEARKALAILDGKLKTEEVVDADDLPAQSSETQNTEVDRFTCPACGGRMRFEPTISSLVCEFCYYAFDLDDRTVPLDLKFARAYYELAMSSQDNTQRRRYLNKALEAAPILSISDRTLAVKVRNELLQITDDPAEKRVLLQKLIALNPADAQARKTLAILDGKLKPEEIVDPDHLPAQSTQTQNARADRFTCPKCGSRMVFDSEGRSLVCESCARNQALGSSPAPGEQDFIVAMATGQGQRKPVAMKTFNCLGCGANFLLPPQVISETCAYCGSVHVVHVTRDLVEPDSVIPMAFNQRDAAGRLVKWIEKHKITPEGTVQAPRGLYLPVWTFDIMGNVTWQGIEYRNKEPQRISGQEMANFDDIVIPATSKLGDLFQKVLTDLAFSGAVAYDPHYLAGWPAEIYETAMAAASLEARAKATHSVRNLIHRYFLEVIDLSYSTSNLSVVSFKLVLVPVWVTEYSFEGRSFRILINGQNGVIHGETPSQGILDWLEDLFGG